jgi:hypothetical protein
MPVWNQLFILIPFFAFGQKVAAEDRQEILLFKLTGQ